MTDKSIQHREKVNQTFNGSALHNHQRDAAQRTFTHFQQGVKAVIIAAEMQSGKSGIALALACLQRNSLSDEDICQRNLLKDTLYLVTMADVALLEQAKTDLSACPNVAVSNFIRFRQVLAVHFKQHPPKLIVIDECHYGSGADAVRYSLIFDYLEQENSGCRIAFVSATPFSALYAAGADSILRDNFHTRLVFHKTSHDYHGIRQMHRQQQIIKLDETQRNFCDESLLQRRFIRQFQEAKGPGWALVRVPGNSANQARQILLAQGVQPEQIYIIGQKLSDVADEELSSINDFKRAYETAQLFDDKLIAITVAGFRAGINFGQAMKEDLIATWDSTIANIAAVVQANIGRACGYHHNTRAKHYTNLDAIRAYSDLLDHLESHTDSDDFAGLHQVFEAICIELREAIQHIRHELLKDGEPARKKGRALRGEHQNWIKAQWVNGVTYDDHTDSCAKQRTLRFTQALDAGDAVIFNTIVNPGGGEVTKDKRVMASIFSIYNLSGQMDAFKRAMDEDDMAEICSLMSVPYTDTLIVLFKRGEFSVKLTTQHSEQELEIKHTRIRDRSVF
ncbi:DEAD/DEAH box helicase family protein [Thiothrix lacustris]|uniref:DEAD/DEAH box helicase family protein n=1 Tax=Thiothrix lacustris TaxID=525917 RepID=UPI0027E4BDA0|nr:DEAD/DEAH box helicase family protein [Thiothrix lacustris]WMP17092.1 DEAD/DEAH box helicase family protein [Thiothrix lacustris]